MWCWGPTQVFAHAWQVTYQPINFNYIFLARDQTQVLMNARQMIDHSVIVFSPLMLNFGLPVFLNLYSKGPWVLNFDFNQSDSETLPRG